MRHANNPVTRRLMTYFWAVTIGTSGLSGCVADRPQHPNIILVSIDTLRADRVGRLGPDGQSITPNLDALAAESLVFEQAYSTSNESLYAHASMFTGRLPTEIGQLDYRTFRVLPGTVTLASTLKAEGYRTLAAVGGGHLSAEFGLNEGFDDYWEGDNFSGFRQTMPMAIKAMEDATQTADPFFMFIHGYDCHAPYIKPGPAGRIMTPEYDGPFLELAAVPMLYEQIYQDWYAPQFQPHLVKGAGEADFISTAMFEALVAHIQSDPANEKVELTQADKDFLIGTYDAAVMYADMWIGVLLSRLEALELTDDTVVMVVSDHGEGLLDHGFFNHRSGLWLENIHVPMILRAPGLAPGVRPEPVSLTAVGNTLLGHVEGVGRLAGEDLLKADSPFQPIVVSEGANGDLSARNARFALRVSPGTQVGKMVPAARPKGVVFTDSTGKELPWSPTSLQPLWSSLHDR